MKKGLTIKARIWGVFGTMLLVSLVITLMSFSVIKDFLGAQYAFNLTSTIEENLFEQEKHVWRFIAGDVAAEGDFMENVNLWLNWAQEENALVDRHSTELKVLVDRTVEVFSQLLENDFFELYSSEKSNAFTAIDDRAAAIRQYYYALLDANANNEEIESLTLEIFRLMSEERLLINRFELASKASSGQIMPFDLFLEKNEAIGDNIDRLLEFNFNENEERKAQLEQTLAQNKQIRESVSKYSSLVLDYQTKTEVSLTSVKSNLETLKNNIGVKTANQARLIAIMFGLAMGAIFLLVILGTYIISVLVINPILTTKNAAMQISKGRLNQKIKVVNNDEIGDLAKAFNKMTKNLRGKIKELDEKNELVALFLHQIRSPITAIKWYNEFLLENNGKKFSKTEREYLENIRINGEHLSQLAQQFLHTNSLEQGKLKLNTVKVVANNYLASIVKDLEPSLKSYNASVDLTLAKSKKAKIEIDENLIYQVFQNVILNAAKYDGKTPKIEIKAEVEDGNYLVTVKDNGMGIPAKERKHIFKKMFRASNANKAVSGNGLGLYLAKMIMEKAGGDISFKSILGKGTTFYISLPIVKIRKKKK